MIRRYLVLAFFVLLAIYIVFQGRFLIFGPRLTIDTPLDNATVDAGPISISGTAQNVSFLSLNDRQIYTDESGHWQDKLIAIAGINIIKLDSRDRFGRETIKTIRILAK